MQVLVNTVTRLRQKICELAPNSFQCDEACLELMTFLILVVNHYFESFYHQHVISVTSILWSKSENNEINKNI